MLKKRLKGPDLEIINLDKLIEVKSSSIDNKVCSLTPDIWSIVLGVFDLSSYVIGVKVMGYRERRRYDRGQREMHKITCSDCGEKAEVPFKPTMGRPVYCQECFKKHRPPRRY
ncbi:CxxC-x17-CxxC domain-containing protein [Thermoproteota archaeon]